MKLTYDQALRLHNQLVTMDNTQEFKPSPRIVARIALNLDRLEPIFRLVQRKRQAIQMETIGHMNRPQAGDVERVACMNDQMSAFLAEEIEREISILCCRVSDLLVDGFRLNASALRNLQPMLSDLESFCEEDGVVPTKPQSQAPA